MAYGNGNGIKKGEVKTSDNCKQGDPECPVFKKKTKLSKEERKMNRRVKRGEKKTKRGEAGKKILVKATKQTQQKSLSTSQAPGKDVSAHVLNPNIAKDPVITKKTVDVRDPFTTKTKEEGHYLSDVGSPTIKAEGDYDADFQRAKNIGMSSQGAQAFAGGGFKEEGPPETATTGGLRRKYMEQGLYKKTKSGLKKKKSFEHITTYTPDYKEGDKVVKTPASTELLTQKGGRVKQYKSKEDMSREELKGKRKLGGTKYVSKEKIQRKKERMISQMKPKERTIGKGKSLKQSKRIAKRDYTKTKSGYASLLDFEANVGKK